MNTFAQTHRRGIVLLLVLVVTVLVGGALTVLATWTAEGYRARQADRARLTAHAIADSAAAYARAHLADWSARLPEQPIALDASAMLSPNMTGSAIITFPVVDGRRVCRVAATAEIGPNAALDEIDLNMP